MPASVTLSRLSYTGSDGRPLFSDLDLTFGAGRTGLVGRNGVGKTTLLRLITGELAPSTGSVAVHGRLRVLRQEVQPGPDETVADLFGARGALALLERAAAGEASAAELAAADWTLDTRLADALAEMGLDVPPDTLLSALSGGEWTRAALAALVFDAPDLILLDEPTNNLDAGGRALVVALLSRWRGAAITVSHDRDLLDRMDAIVELTSLGASTYGGNWSHYRERKALELAAARHDVNVAERQIEAAALKARELRERQSRRNAAGRRTSARGDIPRIILGAMKSRAEGTTGGIDRAAQLEAETLAATAAAARARVEVLAPFAVTIAQTQLPAGKTMLRAAHLTGGHDPARPVIRDLSFDLVGPERVAITGPNGAGKTTLLRLLTGGLAPLAGEVQVGGSLAFLDQQVALLERDRTILDNFRRLNPEAPMNACRAMLAAFRFRADAALQQVGTLSGGEMMRAALACVLGGAAPPLLLVLDEPTNHLDIDSIEVIEAGLRAYDGALLVVSHDRAFLENVDIGREIVLPAG
jgi:ATPase subunit of ABC transporter with duplicated ATPase domains